MQIQLKKDNKTPLQIPEHSYSDVFAKQIQNPSLKLQQLFAEVFSLKQTQVENERVRLEHQRRIETANQILREEELERNQLLQQLNQPATDNKDDNFTLEKSRMIPSTSETETPQQNARSEFSKRTPFIFLVITERQKELSLRMLSALLEVLFIIKQIV